MHHYVCESTVDSYDDCIFGRLPVIHNDDGSVTTTSGGLFDLFRSFEPFKYGDNTATLGPPVIYPPEHPNKFPGIVTPQQCMQYGITYNIHVRSYPFINGVQSKYSVYFASLPFIVGSKFFQPKPDFYFNANGYFVVDGQEIVLTMQEEHRHGIPIYCAPGNCYVKCYLAKFNLTIRGNTDGARVTVASHSKGSWSVADLLRVMGDSTPFLDHFDPILHNVLRNTIESEDPISEIAKALNYDTIVYTERSKREVVMQTVRKHLLPSFGQDLEQKKLFLIDITSKLAKCIIGLRPFSEEVSLEYKRISTVGMLMYDMIQHWSHEMVNEIRDTLSKSPSKTIFDAFEANSGLLSTKCKLQLKTGNWHRLNVGMTRKLPRNACKLNQYVSVRNINNPTSRDSNDISLRLIKGTEFGYQCPSSTPENKHIGLIKSPAFTCKITLKGDFEAWRAFLKEHALEHGEGRVKLNEYFIGFGAQQVYAAAKRRKQTHDPFAAVFIDEDGDLIVDIDEGRMTRPLFVYGRQNEDGRDWNDLIKQGIVEYVDTREQKRGVYIKTQASTDNTFPYTHVELHDANLFSLEAALIPFSNHDQGPRLQLAAVMGKGAIDLDQQPYTEHKDDHYRLWYAQKPLCSTDHERITGDRTCGVNAFVLINTDAYNQEDSCVFNKHFIDKAGLTIDCYSAVKHTLKPDQYFGYPSTPLVSNPHKDYSRLDKSDGVIQVGSVVRDGVVFACKMQNGKHVGDFVYTNPIPREPEEIYGLDYKPKYDEKVPRNLAKPMDNESVIGSTYVHEVRLCEVDSVVTMTVMLRQTRRLIPGDKIVSSHSQKNITARIVNAEDLPFTSDGLIPDIVINPHCMPSRVTIGQSIESLCSKLICIEPEFLETICDPTPFSTSFNLERVREELLKRAVHPGDKFRFTHPHTGEFIPEPLVCGPVYYSRLPHLVDRKIACRSEGPMVEHTNQPTKGRKRNGGNRIGEMEKMAIIAHGASEFLYDKGNRCSDQVQTKLCLVCGVFTQMKTCCDAATMDLEINYSTIMLQRISRACNIDLRFNKKPSIRDLERE